MSPPAGACTHYVFSSMAPRIRHHGPPASKISRRLRIEHEDGEKCTCTGDLKQHMDVKQEDKMSDLYVISSIALWLEMCYGPSWATCLNAFQTTESWVILEQADVDLEPNLVPDYPS